MEEIYFTVGYKGVGAVRQYDLMTGTIIGEF
jgi:hypothetical protein